MSGNSPCYACSRVSVSAANGPWVAPSSPKNGPRTAVAPGQGICTPGITSEFFCGAGQLYHRKQIRLARDVCRWRAAGATPGLGTSRRDRACVLEAERRRRSNVENLAAIRESLFERSAPENDPQLSLHAGFHLRPLGRNGLRSRRSHRACRNRGEDRTVGGANRLARHHACLFGDYSRLPGDALARGEARQARRFRIFLRADGGFHRAHLRKGFLSRSTGSALVLCLSFLSWIWRRKFCRLHALAPRTIPNRMPRQRFCFFHLFCEVRRGGDHVSRWRRRAALRIAGTH